MMAFLLLILALVLGIAGGFLLYYDRTQRAADAQHSTDAQGSADVQGSADADTPQDTDSQHGPDTQQRDAAAGGSDNSAAEQSQGGKPQHSREGQDAPSHAVTEPGENAEDAARTEGFAESEGEVGTEAYSETHSGTPSGFAAKRSPSPDIESDSSSATSSGRHHRTGDDADRRVSDKASDDTRTGDSTVLSDNDAVKNDAVKGTAITATTSTTNAAHGSGADGADNADSVDSADSVGSADRTGRAHAAGNTEKPAEAGLDSASDSSSASGADSGANNDAGLDAEAEAESGADASFEETGHEETEDQPESHAKPKPVGRPRPLIPGTIRRERKNWAETRGFEYMKSDQYLVDEWTRGVASSGAAPKDIVAGNVYGHEMLLMDIDGVNVMAMRTGAASDVVIDFQRFDSQEAEMSEDLLLAMNIEGFDVYSSDRGVTERMVDERVRIALQRMPEVVSALWLETEWVLAQTTKHSRTADWEAMLPPLALLADASRVLPPRSSSVHTIHFEDLDPAREIPAPPVVEAVGGTASVGKPEFSRPVIQRPEEPLDMPSRTYSETRGPVEHTAIGADEVDAIADGNERPTPDSGTARLPRQQFGEASIFGDAPHDEDKDASDAAGARDKDRHDDSGPQQGE